MNELIRRNRQRIEQDLVNSSRWHLFSPVRYSQYRVTLPLLQRFATGRLIDLGCGSMPFRAFLAGQTTAYDSLDLYPRTATTYVGDIQNMLMIDNEAYDTAVCLEVLEHVQDPPQALREIHRILKPGGILIVSVPHLSRLHDEPHDYYRFTRHGMDTLLERAGFRCELLQARGGLCSFIGHQISTASLGLVWGIPVLRDLVWFLNSWLVTRAFYDIDTVLDRAGMFAAGYSVVARKDDRGSQSTK